MNKECKQAYQKYSGPATIDFESERDFEAGWQAAREETAREIGGALCNLIGNRMLEDKERGMTLGEELCDFFKYLQALAGITPNLPKKPEGKDR